MPQQIRTGIPLLLRQKYLTQMYPDLDRATLEAKVTSLQQRSIFCLYYGFECESQSNPQIRATLGIRSHNQVAVQLKRAETKLGVDDEGRYELLKKLRKEYYKEHRPKCPHCRASRTQFRGVVGSEVKWVCGRCKRAFRGNNNSLKSDGLTTVMMSFGLDESDKVYDVVLKVNGVGKPVSGSLRLRVGDEDWNLTLGEEEG